MKIKMRLVVCSECGKNIKIPWFDNDYAIHTGCYSCGHWYPDPTVRVTPHETREELDKALKNKTYNTEPRKE